MPQNASFLWDGSRSGCWSDPSVSGVLTHSDLKRHADPELATHRARVLKESREASSSVRSAVSPSSWSSRNDRLGIAASGTCQTIRQSRSPSMPRDVWCDSLGASLPRSGHGFDTGMALGFA